MSRKNTEIEGIIATTRNGIGFFPFDHEPRAVRISYEHLNTALNGDTVRVRIHERGVERTGIVLEVIHRSKTRFVGVLEKDAHHFYVVPDDARMYVDIAVDDPRGASVGDKVIVRLNPWNDPAHNPTGIIENTIGKKGDHEAEIISIVADRGIDTTFPEPVAKAAQVCKREWDTNGARVVEESIARGERKDFRPVPTVTIDPEDAKDFDDAISLRELTRAEVEQRSSPALGTLYEVGIHIADVSHFVKPDSELDEEAMRRGFSVYLVDRTIPMLPPELSNDLCSLNPNTDRLAFSAVFIVDENARIHDRWFGKSVIHSDKRFSYEEAQHTLDRASGLYVEELALLNHIAKTLKERRFKKGSIDFDQDEVKVEIDQTGTPTRIYRKLRLDTHKLIEELMLLANQEVALRIFEAEGKQHVERGFVYRVHDVPNQEKLLQLTELLKALGHPIRIGKKSVSARELNVLFKQIEGTPIEGLVKTAAIRAMAKAAYATKNIGHFGLGFDFYTHFTSPIRRYPDLMVHRALEQYLRGEEIKKEHIGVFQRLAQDLSQKEITIQEAERVSIRYKQVEFMERHLGKMFEGVVSGVTEWGIYVEEKETGAEGLVHIRALPDDYYLLDRSKYRLVGKRTKRTFSLGDKVTFRVTKADVDRKTLDLELV